MLASLGWKVVFIINLDQFYVVNEYDEAGFYWKFELGHIYFTKVNIPYWTIVQYLQI